MSAFKSINSSDVITIPYIANKNWIVSYSDLNKYNIKIYSGKKSNGLFNPDIENLSNGEYERLIFESINHSFYQNYSGSLLETSSRESSLFYISQSQYRPSSSYYNYSYNDLCIKSISNASGSLIKVLSIPNNIIGESIKPGTFYYSSSMIISDDNYGNLYHSQSLVGNIFYEHGIAVITNQSYQDIFTSSYEIGFKNEYTIYEKIIKCTILDKEFLYSYNPTLQKSGGLAELNTVATSSNFSPYITTVGLYNDAHELMAVAKFGQPVPTNSEIDCNLIIKIDL